MEGDLASICSLKYLEHSKMFLLFRLSPIITFPFYLLATFLILRNKSKIVQAVRKQFLKQIVINFIFVILLAVIVCPILEPPIPGYYMTGLLAIFEMNVALPLVLMTHVVLLVALSILQLVKHQLITLSDLRFTKKFDLIVKIIRKMYQCCYLLMVIVAISILPALTIHFELNEFREQAFLYYKNPFVMCKDMFIADHRNWKIYTPYFCSITFGVVCSITGITSVITCLLMIYESRKMVSRETLIMQRNFTGVLIYQALVYITFIIVPVGVISTLFYADIHIQDNGIAFLLMICCQGAINNLMHIVPGIHKLFCRKKQKPTSRCGKDIAMWSSTPSVVVT
ncbi:hypothetical protein GCK72_020576 [Caenorhabditis remanei]|uniref:Serpentine Receptor, class H n=1 Tax=Caenorhabditis remanei TaxID=31234 RepID=A0A6A5GFN8_CAERE|nr:hypothetical protein GCK72_020576 [Caenorhabditis remanei]KAF1754018.1 hypothetical protein GCK72_020576 [Caenorhabditis remanei]